MKQKDLVTLIIAGVISAVLSIVVSKYTFYKPSNRQQVVEVVPSISSSFDFPDSTFLNQQSIDATQLIQIGNSTNPTPFNAPSQ